MDAGGRRYRLPRPRPQFPVLLRRRRGHSVRLRAASARRARPRLQRRGRTRRRVLGLPARLRRCGPDGDRPPRGMARAERPADGCRRVARVRPRHGWRDVPHHAPRVSGRSGRGRRRAGLRRAGRSAGALELLVPRDRARRAAAHSAAAGAGGWLAGRSAVAARLDRPGRRRIARAGAHRRCVVRRRAHRLVPDLRHAGAAPGAGHASRRTAGRRARPLPRLADLVLPRPAPDAALREGALQAAAPEPSRRQAPGCVVPDAVCRDLRPGRRGRHGRGGRRCGLARTGRAAGRAGARPDAGLCRDGRRLDVRLSVLRGAGAAHRPARGAGRFGCRPAPPGARLGCRPARRGLVRRVGPRLRATLRTGRRRTELASSSVIGPDPVFQFCTTRCTTRRGATSCRTRSRPTTSRVSCRSRWI